MPPLRRVRAKISQSKAPTRARAGVRPIEASRSASATRSATVRPRISAPKPGMLREQAGEALAAEGAQDDVGDRRHRLRRFGEGEQRQAENIARKVEPHDLAAAIAEHGAGVEPARLDDEELARPVILADDDRAAPKGANLFLQPVKRFPFALGQAQMIAQAERPDSSPETTPPAQIRKPTFRRHYELFKDMT